VFKVNLLPKEVVERRRYEGWYGRVFLIGAGLVVIVLAVYALFAFEASSKQGELQGINEQAKQLSAVAEQLAVFEKKEQELRARETAAQGALAGRINVGQIANDVSLVLPDEVWLDSFSINQDTGIVLSANTPRTAGESADVAYKSVAKTLVRLGELNELTDVWLSSATNGQWSAWATAEGAAAAKPVNVVTFGATCKIVRPPGSTAATATSGGASGTTGQGATSSGTSANGSKLE
jgi:Tfp pilus assembly protein PilN